MATRRSRSSDKGVIMYEKHVYITVEEQENFKALAKQYELKDSSASFQRERESGRQVRIKQQGNRRSSRRRPS